MASMLLIVVAAGQWLPRRRLWRPALTGGYWTLAPQRPRGGLDARQAFGPAPLPSVSEPGPLGRADDGRGGRRGQCGRRRLLPEPRRPRAGADGGGRVRPGQLPVGRASEGRIVRAGQGAPPGRADRPGHRHAQLAPAARGAGGPAPAPAAVTGPHADADADIAV